MSKFKHKFMLKIRSNKQGFSLIELLVTIAIIGILSAVAIPAYQNYTNKAKAGVTESILQTALRNIQINKELGTDSTSADIAESIKSKGKTISNLIINGANNATGKVTIAEPTYCVSVLAKITDPSYPAGCIQQNGTVNPPVSRTDKTKQKICKADGTCKAT